MVKLSESEFLVVSPLSVVPLKIGKNNCKPGETYRKTPSICKIPTLYRANFAEDRHQHSRGGLSVFENAEKGIGPPVDRVRLSL